MATRLDIAKRLYGGKGPQHASESSAGGVFGSSGAASMRYGFAQEDSADGWVKVKLDNSEDVVNCTCDSPIKAGQRVAVIVTSTGQLKALPIGQNIVDMVEQSSQSLAQQIIDEGNAIKDEVDAEMEAFKSEHQLTDADIQHTVETAVSGATEAWEGQISDLEGDIEQTYATKTEVSAGIDGLRTEVGETYATSEGVENEINSAITQASGEIASTVEQNVMNSVGDTFATKTELTQTEQDLTLTINQSVANGYATCSTAAGTAAKAATCGNSNFALKQGFNLAVKFTRANTANNPTLNVNGTGAKAIWLGGSSLTAKDSWEAGDTVLFVYDGTRWLLADPALKIAKTVEAYFKADSTGLTVGQAGEDAAVKMATDGSFQVLDGSVQNLRIDSYNGYSRIQAPTRGKLALWTDGSSVVYMSSAGYVFSSQMESVEFNDVRTTECATTSNEVSAQGDCDLESLPLLDPVAVVVYWHNKFTGHDGSTKAMFRGSSATLSLVDVDNPGTGMTLMTEEVTVSTTGTALRDVTVQRGAQGRASISNGSTAVNNNVTPSTMFELVAITFCG